MKFFKIIIHFFCFLSLCFCNCRRNFLDLYEDVQLDKVKKYIKLDIIEENNFSVTGRLYFQFSSKCAFYITYFSSITFYEFCKFFNYDFIIKNEFACRLKSK